MKKSEWVDLLKNKKHNFKFIKKSIYKKSDITYQTIDNFPSNLFTYSTEKTSNTILIVVVEVIILELILAHQKIVQISIILLKI